MIHSRLLGGRLAFERAIRYSGLPAPARHLALTLATWADIESGLIPDRFQPSLTVLTDATGLSEATVKRHLGVLESEGWLLRDRPEVSRAQREHARTKYALLLPEPESAPGQGSERAQPGLIVSPGIAHTEPWQGSERAGAGLTVSHKSPLNTGESLPPSPPSVPEPPPRPAPEREGGRVDAPLTEEERRAADALARITATVPQLVLGERELAALAPLVVPWLERTTEARLTEALTAGLPAVVGSPVGFLRRRLESKLPPAVTVMATAPPSGTPVPPSWAERQALLDALTASPLPDSPADRTIDDPVPAPPGAKSCRGHEGRCGRPAVSLGWCRRCRVAAQLAADAEATTVPA